MIKPPVLKSGDRVAIITPASPYDPKALEEGIIALQSLGLEVDVPGLNKENKAHIGYLAASDEERMEEIHQAFSDRGIKAIFCARGGYGSIRLLDRLKLEIISKNPKIFVGYSDLTALLNFLTFHYSLITFHGPVVAMDLNCREKPKTLDWLKKVLMEVSPLGVIDPRSMNGEDPEVIHPGTGRGILVGGNLSLVAAMMGTDFELNTDGKILFLEDKGEKLYRLDRLFHQLKLAGKFDKVSGILLGEFVDCEELGNKGALDVIRDVFKDYSVPILYGFPAGHCSEKITLPLGVQVILDADKGILNVTEAGVQ